MIGAGEGGTDPVSVAGIAAVRDWYGQIVENYERVEVQPISHVCGEWYIYTDELRHVGGSGPAIRVVSYHPLTPDGRFLARVAYATWA